MQFKEKIFHPALDTATDSLPDWPLDPDQSSYAEQEEDSDHDRFTEDPTDTRSLSDVKAAWVIEELRINEMKRPEKNKVLKNLNLEARVNITPSNVINVDTKLSNYC